MTASPHANPRRAAIRAFAALAAGLAFAATASEKLLEFRFDVAAKKAAPATKEGVRAEMTDWSKE